MKSDTNELNKEIELQQKKQLPVNNKPLQIKINKTFEEQFIRIREIEANKHHLLIYDEENDIFYRKRSHPLFEQYGLTKFGIFNPLDENGDKAKIEMDKIRNSQRKK